MPNVKVICAYLRGGPAAGEIHDVTVRASNGRPVPPPLLEVDDMIYSQGKPVALASDSWNYHYEGKA